MSDLVAAQIAEAFTNTNTPPVTDDIPRQFDCVDDGRYRMRVGYGGIEFELDRIRRDRNLLNGELLVRCDIPGARTYDGTLSCAGFNLTSATARTARARLLATKSEAQALPWDSLLEEFSIRVLNAERRGDPAKPLRDYPKPEADDHFTVEGVSLLKQHPVILFGDGGTAKSFTALYLAGVLEQAGTKVLYCDWECGGEDHRDRLERLFGVPMPGMLYARCDRPLTFEADRLRRIVAENDASYVVYDSVAFACDGPPESAEVAAAYFRAVRQIGRGSLHIAHTTKGENADKKPFGSAFWSNGARRVYYVKPSEQVSASSLTIGLFDRKRNVGPQSPAVGFHITFDRDRTVYTPVDIRDVQDLSAELPLWKRIRNAVRARPLTLVALADDLSAKVDSVEKAVKRRASIFTKVDGADGVQRVALLARDDE